MRTGNVLLTSALLVAAVSIVALRDHQIASGVAETRDTRHRHLTVARAGRDEGSGGSDPSGVYIPARTPPDSGALAALDAALASHDPVQLDAAMARAARSHDPAAQARLGFVLQTQVQEPEGMLDGLAWMLVACGDCTLDDPLLGLGASVTAGQLPSQTRFAEFIAAQYGQEIANEVEARAASLAALYQ